MNDFKHEFKDVYYGIKCKKCGVFYPDGMGPWVPEDEIEPPHSSNCICETCLQDYPEREYLVPE